MIVRLFTPTPTIDRPPYVVAIPPPNVTGSLHMGHALNDTIQDILIRHHHLRGFNTLWIVGTDHAGIATQNKVEAQLARDEGLRKEDIGREAFEKRVWEWRREYGSTIIHQLKSLGSACDYDSERFTMDEGYQKAVVKVFVDLYNKGDIYRDVYLVNWCVRCGSAISDLEVEHEDRASKLYYVTYPLADSGETLTVATTRPETILGDTAVAVNPKDPRYGHLVGHMAIVPLAGREVPVIADEHVDIGFGTGALKITPGHDPDDWEIGMRHGLPSISVIGLDGLMTEEAGRFAGLTTAEARAAVLRGSRGGGALRQGRRLRPRGQHLLPLRHHHRAAALAAVVHEDGQAGAAGHQGGRGRPRALRAGALGRGVSRVDEEHPALVREPAALVGAPRACVLLRGVRPPHGRGDGAGRVREVRWTGAARAGRARHLVQLGALAVRHARLAGEEPAVGGLLPDDACSAPPATSSTCGWPA